jgi:hypothetical protein
MKVLVIYDIEIGCKHHGASAVAGPTARRRPNGTDFYMADILGQKMTETAKKLTS